MSNSADPSLRLGGLMLQAEICMRSGQTARAEELFRQAAELSCDSHVLNNWAMLRYQAGDLKGALELIAPVLEQSSPEPYPRALASLLYNDLGQADRARTLLQAAIRDFEAGIARPELRGEVDLHIWIEYGVLVKQAAGNLGDHRLVLDLHGRWPGRDLPLAGYVAGLAAFNLRRFPQAAKYWRRVTAPSWAPFLQAAARVADLAHLGWIPPFPVQYVSFERALPEQIAQEQVRQLSSEGTYRLKLLAAIFDPSFTEAETALRGLVAHSGEWGAELGRRLLEASTLPLPLKMAAAKGLFDQGLLPLDQPVPILHMGERAHLVVKMVEAASGGLKRTTPVDPTDVSEWFRLEAEEKPISLNLTLRSALRRIPVEWLNAIAAVYRLEPVRRRPERERLAAEALLTPDRIREVLSQETPDVAEAIRWVLDRGGAVKLQQLTRRFGPMDGDGFWWNEAPPLSTIGRLRYLGLLYVGRARVDGRLHKVAVVPLELRPVLRACL